MAASNKGLIMMLMNRKKLKKKVNFLQEDVGTQLWYYKKERLTLAEL